MICYVNFLEPNITRRYVTLAANRDLVDVLKELSKKDIAYIAQREPLVIYRGSSETPIKTIPGILPENVEDLEIYRGQFMIYSGDLLCL